MTQVKFGVFVPQGWVMDLVDIEDPIEKYETMSRCAREAEQAGFDSIWLYDHFHTVPRPVTEAVFECWTAMAALARDTSTVRLGQMVTCNAYRPPALLAKMSSCIDVLSHGRLIVGIGAGWYQHEFDAYGYEYGDAPSRLRDLRETLQVLYAMWTQERATFEGRSYQVRGAINEPKPVQQPYPPLWIGGGGERVTLKLVAQYGDACNVGGGDPAVVRHKLDVLRRHCDAAGRDYDTITKSTNVEVYLGDSAEIERLVTRRARQTGRRAEAVAEGYAGTPAEVAERIREVTRAGIDYVVLRVPNAAEGGAIQRVAQELLPLLA
jgi:F420-dependent oxidoreductase-like protein